MSSSLFLGSVGRLTAVDVILDGVDRVLVVKCRRRSDEVTQLENAVAPVGLLNT